MAIALGDDLDINFMMGAGQVDRIYLGRAFVWPQHPIDDFAASNDLVKQLTFTWTDVNYPLPNSYDLYENNIRIYAGILQGQTLDADPGIAEYYVRSIYEGGHGIDSNKNIGEALSGIAPGPITDFVASRDQLNKIQSWWTNATGDPLPTYDLFQDGQRVRQNVVSGHTEALAPGEYDMHVVAVNQEGEVPSNVFRGESLIGHPPGSITNFVASTNLTLAINFTWSATSGDPTPEYDLYQDGSILRVGVSSGHTESMPAGSWPFYVMARNIAGNTPSNTNTGTAHAEVIPPTYYEAIYDSPGGSQTFTVPPGITSIDVCVIGAGGAGAGCEDTRADFNPTAGGGYSGFEASATHAVTPGQVITMNVGVGGIGRDQNSSGVHNGNPGSNSNIYLLGPSAAGGGGGEGLTHDTVNGWHGDGGNGPGGCAGGGHRHGELSSVSIEGASEWKGYGGQATSAGSGGNGYASFDTNGDATDGVRGAGGGGSSVARTMTSKAGDGGHGYIRISWYAIKKEGED